MYLNSNISAHGSDNWFRIGFPILVERDWEVHHCNISSYTPLAVGPNYGEILAYYLMPDLNYTIQDIQNYPAPGLLTVIVTYLSPENDSRPLATASYTVSSADIDLLLSGNTGNVTDDFLVHFLYVQPRSADKTVNSFFPH